MKQNKFEELLAVTPVLDYLYRNARLHGILVSDENGYILHCNEAFEHAYGYSLQELKGKHGRVLFTGEDQKKQRPEIEIETTKTQGFFRDRNYVVHKNGSCIFSDGESLLTRDGEGNIFLFKIVQNVHEQKVMETLLRENEQRFRNLVEEATVATAIYIGREMRIEYANDAMLKIMGKGKSVLGKPFREALPELNNQPFSDLLTRVYTTGETYWGKEDEASVMIDGKLYTSYYNFSYKPLRNENGEIYGILNMTIDVGEQVRIKKKIQESEHLLRTLVMQAPVGICIVQKDSLKVEIVNDAFLQLVGKSRGALEHGSIWQSIPEAKNFYAPVLENVFSTGERYQGVEHEIMLVRNGKEELVYVSFVYEPLTSDDGKVERVMMLAVDVTLQVVARKKIEEVVSERTKELADANRTLKQSNVELAQFAYIASHDLQEPLRKIRVFSGYLQEHASELLNGREKDSLKKVIDAAKRMSNLINDILDYSRADAAKLQAGAAAVDLNETLQRVIKDLELEIKEKNAVIKAGPLPAVPAIDVQMHQLFYNLLSNSLKFSDKDRRLIIEIKAETPSQVDEKKCALPEGKAYCRIDITDNGIGFDPEYREKIFSMFQRLHPKKEYDGTGIGLAICKKVVENHNGCIAAESEVGKGSTFSVFLPLH